MENELNETLASLYAIDPSALLSNMLNSDVFLGFIGFSLVGAGMFMLRMLYQLALRLISRCFVTQVTFRNTQASYYWVADWLTHNNFHLKARRAIAVAKDGAISVGNCTPVSDSSMRRRASELPGLTLIPDNGIYLLWHRGQPFFLEKVERDTKGMDVAEEFVIRTWGRSRTLIAQIIDEARGLQVATDLIRVYSFAGHWQVSAEKSPRPLDSVILPPDEKQRLVDDLHWFLSGKSWYVERGIPYHRGYLLYGPPGTGKTSLIFAIASHFKLDLCVLSLNSVAGDEALVRAFTDAPANSIMLMEDIDRIAVSNANRPPGATTPEKITLSGLLNTLDGISAREGRIIVMTSNHPEKLDPALVRSGRVDIKIEIGLPGPSEKASMYRRFYPNADEFVVARWAQHASGSMADLQEHLIRGHQPALLAVNQQPAAVMLDKDFEDDSVPPLLFREESA